MGHDPTLPSCKPKTSDHDPMNWWEYMASQEPWCNAFMYHALRIFGQERDWAIHWLVYKGMEWLTIIISPFSVKRFNSVSKILVWQWNLFESKMNPRHQLTYFHHLNCGSNRKLRPTILWHSGPLHTWGWEPVTTTLQALSLVEKAEPVQVHYFTLH